MVMMVAAKNGSDMTWRGIARTIERMEGRFQGFFYGTMAFLSIAYLRTLLEGTLEAHHWVGLSADPLVGLVRTAHHLLFYLAIFLSIILAVRAAAGARVGIRPLTRIALLCFPILLLPPIMDALITGGAGLVIRYQRSWNLLPGVFINSFNPFVTLPGITPGQRIEVFLVCLGAGGYVWLKSQSTIRAGLAFLAAYSVVCLYAFFPSICGSLATGLFGFTVPEGQTAAEALFPLSGVHSSASQVELRFVLLNLLVAGLLGSVWFFVNRRGDRSTQGTGHLSVG